MTEVDDVQQKSECVDYVVGQWVMGLEASHVPRGVDFRLVNPTLVISVKRPKVFVEGYHDFGFQNSLSLSLEEESKFSVYSFLLEQF